MKSGICRILALFVVLCAAFSLFPAQAFAAAETAEEIVVLYTNDIHTRLSNSNLRYSSLAAMKKELQAEIGENNVFLIDAGDHVTGTSYGTMNNGTGIVEIMNAAGYDLATFGNHEFDYGMNGVFNLAKTANFPYVSCNFYNISNGEKGDTVFDAYKIFETDGKKIAFVGITTPETFENIRVGYFKDKDDNFIYGISCGPDGSELYSDVQKAVDSARAEGADYVIAVGHLGIDETSSFWTSRAVIANTDGIDAFIDGHSHHTVENELVENKNGELVPLTQTGTRLEAVGKMTINSDGISTELITSYSGIDETTKAVEEAWIEEVDAAGNFPIVYDKYNFDPALEIARVDSAPDVTDGVLDSSYTKIFELTGSSCVYESYDGSIMKDARTPLDMNNDSMRYDHEENPSREDSDWYNTTMKGFASWDSSKLYFYLEITGPGFVDDNTSDANMCYGDGFQIAFYYDDSQAGNVNYCFAQNNSELLCYRYDDTGLSLIQRLNAYNSTKLPGGGFYRIDDDTVVYEIALEWSSLGVGNYGAVIEENMEVPFNVSVNLNDENRGVYAFCGFQVGYGIFNGTDDLMNSLRLKLVNEVESEPEAPEGLVFEEDGDIVYYENGVKVAKGLVEHEGSYYFINSTLKAVKDCEYAFSEKASNGLMPAGKYTFGADGKMIIKEGLVFETNGDICYYENGIKVAKGLVQDEYGNYYFINSTLKAVKNCEYAFSTEKANGLLSSGGKYTFDADGKMIVPENGLVFEEDGDIVYYENGVKVAKGLVEYEGSYYFINSTLKAVKDCEYAFNASASNGLMPAGKYTFDADGKMILD